jgi:arabinoxylan arabinofuranohydrolase
MYKKLFLTITVLTTGLTANAQTLATDYKGTSNVNPISSCVFCADPTAIDYKGRLYVYGTNDHQQFIKNGKKGSNGYGNIKSLVVFSTDDMVNWTFHGTIDVGKVCGGWCGQSWAPSAVWRTTDKGVDEFFIYFANGGGSVGVIKSTTSPVGPFKSPRTSAMITQNTPGVRPCNWVFDPGAVIDSTGQGWIAFGGGDPQSSGSKLWPGNSRIAKLSSTMTSISGSAVNMPAPYLFEASELNIMDGKFVYTYNTSWSDRNDWSKFTKRNGQPAPSTCSMCYMVSDNPLDPESWEYRGEYVANPGSFGFGSGNNHTHLQKFEGNYYLFYHSSMLEQSMKTGASGFRSIGVNKATVNESTQKIGKVTMSKTGISAIKKLNPYELQQAETMSTSGGISYEDFTNITKVTSINTLGNDASKNLQVKMAAGAWTFLRGVDFGETGASKFTLNAKGTGTLEIRLASKTAKAAATVDFSSTTISEHTVDLDPTLFTGVKSVYFVFSKATNVQFDSWQFFEPQPNSIQVPYALPEKPANTPMFDLNGRRMDKQSYGRGIYIRNGKKVIVN